jgi:drug/metabolite transporter (DMT)-like permease
VFAKKSDGAIIASLVTAVFLWGGSNAGTKYLVRFWRPEWVGSTRFLCAGLIMLAILKWTRWLGVPSPLTAADSRDLWLRGGLMLAVYIVVFNWALHYTNTSHVALYLGMSPVWTLLWDEPPGLSWRAAQRYGAAACALGGVVVLFWPSMRSGTSSWIGELLGLAASVLWATYGVQCRFLGKRIPAAEVSAHSMFRAGMLLLPFGLLEVWKAGLLWRTDLVLIQGYCLIAGGVLAYLLWANALRQWQTSRVFLFNNLIPLSTMSWARVCLGEPFTSTFWLAMILVLAGVVVGQANWQKVLGARWVPMD